MEFINVLYFTTAILILFYAVDDVALDLYYWSTMTLRQLFRRRRPPLTMEKLNARPEKRIALMIPCWQESEVVARMLTHTLSTINYHEYDVFIGVYPNDPATRQALVNVKKDNPHIHEVLGLKDGPTTKAENLNAIYDGILEYEQRSRQYFDIFVIHDAEDVIHPLSFKLYNYLMPEKDMVQLPVFPLDLKLSRFTHWTYADEFAENHTKDMIAREWIGGFVPSAGVGTAFTRRVTQQLYYVSHGMLFSSKTLTEDYSFSLFLHRYGFKGIFVHQSVKRIENRPRFYFFGRSVPYETKEWIATRSLFPLRYSNAMRQKSRWVLGISLQEWRASGWLGNKQIRYSLVRDRKGPFGHLLILCGYVILAYWIAHWALYAYTGRHVIPPLAPLNRTLAILVLLVMSHRLLERAIAVWRIYGLSAAVLSVPRTVYLNVVNIHAFARALKLFVKAERKNEPVAWAKTANRFPSAEQLTFARRRLGDLLLENSSIDADDLVRALSAQRQDNRRLGEILRAQGIITEDELDMLLERQQASQ